MPYHECHECKNVLKDPAEDAECSKCGHKKCESCPRLSPRRVEPEPDPAVLKSVEEKLAALRLERVAS